MTTLEITRKIAQIICAENPGVAFSECRQAVEDNLGFTNETFSNTVGEYIISRYFGNDPYFLGQFSNQDGVNYCAVYDINTPAEIRGFIESGYRDAGVWNQVFFCSPEEYENRK